MKIDDQFMELVLNHSKEDSKKIRILTSGFFLMCFHLCMILESLLYDRQTSKCYVYMIHEHRAVFLRKDKFSAEYNFSLMELVYIIGRTCQI